MTPTKQAHQKHEHQNFVPACGTRYSFMTQHRLPPFVLNTVRLSRLPSMSHDSIHDVPDTPFRDLTSHPEFGRSTNGSEVAEAFASSITGKNSKQSHPLPSFEAKLLTGAQYASQA